MDLYQLIYLSQASRKMSNDDLLDILQSAKNNNGEIDVTGSLFYNGGWFLQVLEGPKAMIETLYRKIELDPRHRNSRILYLEPARSRTFSRWTMNMTNLDHRQGDRYQELVQVIEAAKGERRIGSTPPAVQLLKLFREDGREAA